MTRRGVFGQDESMLVSELMTLGLPLVAAVLCVWLLSHTGWTSVAAAAGIALAGSAASRPAMARDGVFDAVSILQGGNEWHTVAASTC